MKHWLIVVMLIMVPVCLAEKGEAQDVTPAVSSEGVTGNNPSEIREQMEKLKTDLKTLEIELEKTERPEAPQQSVISRKSSGMVWKGRWYLGGGFLYDIESFRNELSDYDFNNSWGLNLKVGYLVSDYVALEFLFQYHAEFKATDSGRAEWLYVRSNGTTYMQAGNYDQKVTLEGQDFTLNIKGRYPMGQTVPYALLGFGYMNGKAELDYSFKPYSSTAAPFHRSDSESESGACVRLGAGGDFMFNDNFGLNAEIAYNIGLSDVDNIRFISVNVGALYLF